MRYFLCAALIGGPLLVNFAVDPQAGQQPKRSDVAEERRRAFAWASTLGYPDTKNLKFVLVSTGDWLQHGNSPPENRFQYGFLIEAQGKSFKVVGLDFEAHKFESTPPDTEAHKAVGYEILDLEKEALAWLAEMKADTDQEKKPRRLMGLFFGPNFSTRTETFLLAWACSLRSLDMTAAKLYDQARDPTHDRYGEDQEKPSKTLQENVADELAHVERWRGVLSFGDPTIGRPDLLKRFERLVKNFLKSSHHARAVETVALLKTMIKEDEDHAASRKKGKPFEQLPRKEQVAELIFQLREQNGHQFMQPGHCDIFDRFAGKADTSAHKLLKIGYDAVPQLIEHLDDERFTRSVGYHRNFYFSHHVLRVSDCALAILEEIAGQGFWEAKSTFSYMSMDKNSGEAKKRVEKWYAELKKKGEKGFLIDATLRGDRNSAEMGRRLLERYPKDAQQILMKAAKENKIDHVRATLVELVASCKGEESLAFLLAELKDGPLAQPRLNAAAELHKHGRPEGSAAILNWWKKSADSKVGEEDPASWTYYIANYLAGCDDLESIQALAKDLHRRPVDLRIHVIERMREHHSRDRVPAKEPAKYATEVERLLITALDDFDERIGSSGTWSGKHFSDPRVCDMAGFVLNERLPKKYDFDLEATFATRNRQIVVMKNVWRAEHKQPLLPLPESRKLEPIPPKKLNPILDRYSAAKEDQRKAIQTEIEKLGLGALPGVMDRRNKANDNGKKAMWNEVVNRLSSIIDEIEFDEKFAKPNADELKNLNALKGKPFEPKSFIKAVGVLLKDSPTDIQGVRIVALRAGDGTGFSIKIQLTTNFRNAKGPPTQWGMTESVKAGQRHLRGLFGAGGLALWKEGTYVDLEKVLTEAVSINPDQPIEIRIYVAPEWRKEK